jgi:hypothetical protein
VTAAPFARATDAPVPSAETGWRTKVYPWVNDNLNGGGLR